MSSSMLSSEGIESIMVLSSLRILGIVFSVLSGLNNLMVLREEVLLAEPETIDHIDDTTTTKSNQFHPSRS